MRTQKQIDNALKAAYIEINNIVALMFIKKNLSEFLDTTEDILINAYVMGAKDTLEMLGEDTAEIDELNIIPSMQSALNHTTEGLTYRNRIILGFFEYSTKEMQRLVGNEYHLMYCSGQNDIAKSYEATTGKRVYKTWHTMKDSKVRDTHAYLEDESIPLDDYFYTWDGDKARFPGDFEKPENVINCRCILTYSVL